MLSNYALDQRNQRWRVWVSMTALILGGLIFGPFYFFAVLQPLVPTTFRTVPPWLVIANLIIFLDNLFISHLVIYLLASVLSIVLALAALVWGYSGWITRFPLLLVLISVIAFPWFYRYHPAVVGAPGYEIRVPTQPGLLDGVSKRAQAGAELRPCEYTLLGWHAEGVLYYEVACGNDPSLFWSFAPDKSGDPQRVPSAPQNLIRKTAQPSALDWVRAGDVRSESEEPHARQVYVKEGSLVSPDDRWVALVARHLYGPEDVVVVKSR